MNPLLVLWYNLQELWPPAPQWNTADIPDLRGKIFLVTGGNAGLGTEAANELKARTGKTDAELVVLPLDLSDLASVKRAASEFSSKENRLDALINNAGLVDLGNTQTTVHGHDLQFGTNVLGHFYLTQLLLPILLSTAASNRRDGGSDASGGDGDGKARVVNVSSAGHWGTAVGKDGPVRYETLFDGPERQKAWGWGLYCQSKSGNILFSHALARKYGDRGIVSTSLNPGSIKTQVMRNMTSLQQMILGIFQSPVELGALTQLYAATAPEAASLNGKYLGPWARIRPYDEKLDDVETQERLWTWLKEQVKLHAPS